MCVQGDKVRKLKEEGALELSLKEAVQELKHRKKILEDKELELTPVDASFDRSKLEGWWSNNNTKNVRDLYFYNL